MARQAQTGTGLYDWLGEHVKHFVRWWRRLDAYVNQPLPTGRKRIWTWLAPDGYPWFVPGLAAILVLVMALGPTVEAGWVNLLLLAGGFGLLLLLQIAAARYKLANQYLLGGQLVILALLVVLLAVSSRPEAYGLVTAAPRLHIGAGIAGALILALGVDWIFASTLFRSKAGGRLASVLPQVELFQPRDRYDFMGKGPIAALVSAFFITPVRYPVELLLPASLLCLFVPDHYLRYVFGVTVLLTWGVLFLAILFDRLMEILQTIGRLFFIGPQRVISILVIAVALLRLANVHYITYLFNAGSSGYGNPTIMGYIAFAYATAWYYAFWCDHFVARRLIRLLDPARGDVTPTQIAYPFAGDAKLSRVRNDGRSISLHGAGRLKIQGLYEAGYAEDPALQFMTPAEVIAQFRNQLEQTSSDISLSGDLLASLRNLQRSTLVYPVLAGALAYLLIGVPVYVTFTSAVQPPELAIGYGYAVDKKLETLLFGESAASGACPALTAETPRIAVAASGGGTRAAIYTASLLRGLAEHGQICNVILVSGVSGGSAALAYFALHETELRKLGTPDEKAWDAFSHTMAAPFIEYAIDRASDMRIAFGRGHWQPSTCNESMRKEEGVTGWMPARSRLGNILAEAFVCKMGSGTMSDPSFGIMLNTSILGTFPDAAHPCKDADGLSLPEQATRCRDTLAAASAENAGGRLVLTNLTPPKRLPEDGSRHMDIITLDQSDISIARAAALSANFPPVFPDAAIDIKTPDGAGRRYWVTDGGAVENRGAMTLYYAVRDALKKDAAGSGSLPPLHVVIADASASAGRYSESFGFGSVLGAGGQLGLGLETEIRADMEKLYCDHKSQISIHEIAMPPIFNDGGIGTHWLLPGTLSFVNPQDPSDTAILSAKDVETLVVSLHSEIPKTRTYDDEETARKVLSWIRNDPTAKHDANWQALLSDLFMPGKTPPACGS